MAQAGEMTVKRCEFRRQTQAMRIGGLPGAPVSGDPSSLLCPLIPGRLKYTCSGRCRGCKPGLDETDQGEAGRSEATGRMKATRGG